jgi:hypothetical protein
MDDVPTITRMAHLLSDGFAALIAGSRTIPLGDNGDLLRELALRIERTAAPPRASRHAAIATDR